MCLSYMIQSFIIFNVPAIFKIFIIIVKKVLSLHLKLIQHCMSTVLQYLKRKKNYILFLQVRITDLFFTMTAIQELLSSFEILHSAILRTLQQYILILGDSVGGMVQQIFLLKLFSYPLKKEKFRFLFLLWKILFFNFYNFFLTLQR